jgi:hypothetical protein
VGPSDNNNIKCFISILEKFGALSTGEIINHAQTSDFVEICSGCKSGTDVISAGLILVEKGLVTKHITKGGYQWQLMK